jgi:hypothetical protein
MNTKTLTSNVLAAVTAFIIMASHNANAHCDTLDGPVVQSAKAALEKSDVTPVLKWVKPDDEKIIRGAFARTIKARAMGKEARDVADLYFFETLVRVHRAGEGVAYTGLKPAGLVEPGIAAADKALETGAAEELAHHTAKAIGEGIMKRYAEVAEKKKHAEDSVDAGRAYVAAYVSYIHFVEAVAALASAEPGGHEHIHSPEPSR